MIEGLYEAHLPLNNLKRSIEFYKLVLDNKDVLLQIKLLHL
ncbi:hypothetical protein [Priestia filamentosa]